MFWNEEVETISEKDLQALQLELLKRTLTRAKQSPHYQAALKDSPDPENLKDIKEIERYPFSTKDDLRRSFPNGMLAVSRDDIVRLHSSSGTTGQATVIYHTQTDIDNWADIMARSVYMAGTRRSDVFQNIVGYGLFTGGLGFHYGMEKVGALVIPAGTGNSRRQINLMRDFGTSVIHSTPSYALHLADVFVEMGMNPAKDVNLNIGFFGAEPYSESTRQRLEEIYDLLAVNSYGLSEMNGPGVGMECPRKKGIHLWEDHFLVEIIDPYTMKTLPPGQEGELVLTTLKREGMPLIRYRTKDLTMIIPEPCPCGRTHRMISRITGRTDDMLIVRGVNFFPMQVEKILMETKGVGNNYMIYLETRGHLDDLHIKVEVVDEELFGNLEALKQLQKGLTESLRSEILLTAHVELLEPNSLPKSEGKAQRVVDNRKL